MRPSSSRSSVEASGRARLRSRQELLTGGSSALRPFQGALRAAFPGVDLVEGDLFGGVAAGLAYAAAEASATPGKRTPQPA